MTAAARVKLQALRDHIQAERDFNEGWIALHILDGHPRAAERRREVVSEREGWLGALDEVIGKKAD
jgi:hypothetical protein